MSMKYNLYECISCALGSHGDKNWILQTYGKVMGIIIMEHDWCGQQEHMTPPSI